MLVITRKKGESILIGDDIEITVSKVEDGSVKLAINAPKEMTILRKELFEEVENQNKEASNINMDILKNLKLNNKNK
ncbi:carbon storage regulator CsrA [Clostridium sp.]|uniref:carbon storage regulator CsrA n=1 Tax=Clostridium sp. TaxID=1506 RepID=UPI002907B782|nr:carbon storage regulator CsrA [Clostridium sp.]MDU5105255.1 carbon storage regulator CsrA [Clostridium sp.]